MPNIQAAKKEVKASSRRRLFNDRRRRAMRKIIKEIRELVSAGNKKEATDKMPLAYKAIDKAAKRGVIKANAASRTKSRLSKLVKNSA